ncbi:hypothetical protein L210DRAFT_3535553 [Boletus edulis BED1]|uniref:Uncharacterized protein n=1 Tax=Boletus edulis BED1 TaxID=1328754 RepID=A0AAD4BYD1_BOLED|nr:hypothetical protein L210DRAFT_3535553 [Boletus edulis BED1]
MLYLHWMPASFFPRFTRLRLDDTVTHCWYDARLALQHWLLRDSKSDGLQTPHYHNPLKNYIQDPIIRLLPPQHRCSPPVKFVPAQ